MIDLHDYCEECGTVLPLDRYANVRRFCSKKCLNLNYRAMERAAKVEERRNRPPCRVCGKPIEAERQGRLSYCGQPCRSRWHGRIKLERKRAKKAKAQP